MTLELFLFYLFSAVLVFSAVMVITAKNPVHAVLFLVLAFFNCSVLWLLLEAEFLAISLVLVYVGAVMVLFLFVVMMIDINMDTMRQGFIRNLPLGVVVAVILAVELSLVFAPEYVGFTGPVEALRHGPDYNNTRELGRVLYTDYVFAFELAAVILLVAIIAAITLTLRQRPQAKYQVASDQIGVNPKDRVRLVDLRAEKPSQTEVDT